MELKKINVIHASWLDDSSFKWCEYCSNKNQKRTYLPFHKNVLNPEHICEICIKENEFCEFEVVDFYEDDQSYRKDLYKLKENNE